MAEDHQGIPGLSPPSTAATPETAAAAAAPLAAADSLIPSNAEATPAAAEAAEAIPVTDSDTFKVPALPLAATSTVQGLPADIEHILSLGANKGDEAEEEGRGGPAKGTNYEQVVREMKEKAGFGEVAMGDEGQQVDGLDAIEREMEAGGVSREGDVPVQGEVGEGAEVKGEEQDEAMLGEEVKPAAEASAAVKMEVEGDDEASSSDSSSDSSSSSDSDSDAPPARATAGPSSTTATPATDASGKKKRVRKRPQRNRAASVDSDLSDDDVNAGGIGAAPRTEHELDQPEVQMPEIEKVPEGVELAQFGKVQSVIETVVVVKADTAGSYKVLDEGTVCCLQDRTVVGSIFETFGSVQQPFYSLRYPAASPPDPTIFTVNRALFYAPTLSSFVFTRELRAMKGSDASNVWDEEVGAAEIEFSDDEQEQEYRRAQKAERRSRTASATPGPSRGSSRAPSARAPSTQPRPPPPGGLSALPARPSTLSYADLDAPDVDTPGPMASGPPQKDVWSMGEKPPSGKEGRRMFERDTGRAVQGDDVEFEFSDGEESVSSVGGAEREERPSAGAGRGGRGGRGRGEARGRGRGAERGRGRGGGRGAAQAGAGGRPVAGLPRGIAGLPQKPAFEAPPTEEERRSTGMTGVEGAANGEQAAAPAASLPQLPARRVSPPPQLRGSLPPPVSGHDAHAPPSFAFGGNAPPPQFFGASPIPPQQHSLYSAGSPYGAPAFQPQYPQPQPQHQHQQQQYSPHQPQPQHQHQQGPPPGAGAGHFNPRFFGAGAGGPPPPPQQYSYPPQQQQQQGYGAPQGYGQPPQQQQYWQGQPGPYHEQQQQPPSGPRGFGGPPQGPGRGGWHGGQ